MRAFARQGEGGRERVCVYDGLKESEGQGKQMCLCLKPWVFRLVGR